jgi:hypothetical protein
MQEVWQAQGRGNEWTSTGAISGGDCSPAHQGFGAYWRGGGGKWLKIRGMRGKK